MTGVDQIQQTVGDLRQQVGKVLGFLESMQTQEADRKRDMERFEQTLRESERETNRRVDALTTQLTALRRDQEDMRTTLAAQKKPLEEFVAWQKRSRWWGTALIGGGVLLLELLMAGLRGLFGHFGDAIWEAFGPR